MKGLCPFKALCRSVYGLLAVLSLSRQQLTGTDFTANLLRDISFFKPQSAFYKIPNSVSLKYIGIEVMNLCTLAGFHRSFNRRHRSFLNIADLISNISDIPFTHSFT
jgi:hypothetical protein